VAQAHADLAAAEGLETYPLRVDTLVAVGSSSCRAAMHWRLEIPCLARRDAGQPLALSEVPQLRGTRMYASVTRARVRFLHFRDIGRDRLDYSEL
jgi:hypothetical protein